MITKKKLTHRLGALALSAVLITGLFTLGAGAASATNVTAQLSPQLNIVVDGVSRDFYTVNGDEAHPIAYNGTTYLPIRAIGELMGKNVNWDQSTLTVTIAGARTTAAAAGTPDTSAVNQNIVAQLRPDFTIVVDGAEATFRDVNGNVVYPLLYKGSTYLPIRAIGELMGKTVRWDGATGTVTLASDSLVTDADTFEPTAKPGTTTGTTGTTTGGTTTNLTAAQAEAKALAHAGLTSGQVTFLRTKTDRENGRLVYEVEFYTTGAEYDYEIDASTGSVVSFGHEVRGWKAQNTSGGLIGLEKAKAIALAKVPGAGAAHIRKAFQDYDDGRMEYEVKLVYNNMEYDFEIDGYSGEILSWDGELLRY